MKVRLGDYIQEYSVRNKTEEEIPVYSVTNTQGFCRDYFGKEVASKDKSTYKIVPRGAFAYNPSRINVGSVDWQRLEPKVIVSPLYNVFTVSPQLDQQFLSYYLKSDITLHFIKAVATGSVRDNLKFAMLCDFPINLPSIDGQREIVQKLDKLKDIINLRQQELQKLDDLIKARFVEMFGALEVNDKHWVEKALGELCEKVIRYPTFYGMEYLESGTRVIRIGNILEDGHMETEECNYVFVYTGVNDDYPETVIELNDIIMAVRGDGSAAKRIGIIRENELIGANISPNLIRIKTSKTMDPIFLFYYLTGEVGQKRLDAYVNKTAKKNIAAKDIVKVIVPVPPIQRQQQFASFVAQVDKSKVAVQKALDEAQLLFDSLMQEYFG